MSDEVLGTEGVVESADEALRLLDGGTPEAAGEEPEAPAALAAPEVPETPEASEAPAAAAPEEPEDSKTQLWAKLTQQDKELRELRKQNKGMTSLEKMRESARKDPARLLQDLGIGIDQVIDALAQQGGMPPAERAEPVPKEIEALRAELAAIKAETASSRQESMVRAEVMRIDEAIRTNPERWEVISAQRDEGSLRLVLETAAELWKQSGEVPDYELVMDSVEEHLAGEARARLNKLSGLKKFRQAPPQPSGAPAPKQKPGRMAPVVDGNAPTGTPGVPSEEDRQRKALELLLSGSEDE